MMSRSGERDASRLTDAAVDGTKDSRPDASSPQQEPRDAAPVKATHRAEARPTRIHELSEAAAAQAHYLHEIERQLEESRELHRQAIEAHARERTRLQQQAAEEIRRLTEASKAREQAWRKREEQFAARLSIAEINNHDATSLLEAAARELDRQSERLRTLETAQAETKPAAPIPSAAHPRGPEPAAPDEKPTGNTSGDPRIRELTNEIAWLKSELARMKSRSADTGGGEGAEWRLRLDDGRQFGPVTLTELESWAEGCRIGPNHHVSRDGVTWIAAQHIPALHMEWTVPLAAGGTFGPVSLFAIRHLIAEGAVRRDAWAESRTTGEQRRVADLLTPEILKLQGDHVRLKHELRRKNNLLAAQVEQNRELRARWRTRSREQDEEWKGAPTLTPPRRIRQHMAAFAKDRRAKDAEAGTSRLTEPAEPSAPPS